METLNLETWTSAVPLMNQGYHRELLDRVADLRQTSTIYPPRGRELYALQVTPYDAVKVVIVGQDPYHGDGQADGLAFSVPDEVPPPPSLRNVFKEIADDIGPDIIGADDAWGQDLPEPSTDLTRWAEQGVLLLNTSLTVEAGRAGSHRDLGWARLTDAIIGQLSAGRRHLVFMLWGKFAQSKRPLIDPQRHLILEAPHPSPLSAYRGFFGCRHFSKANRYLLEHGRQPIRW
ncbi:MAG: uracil-DNA glycosylase [Anaerolineae bacterium]